MDAVISGDGELLNECSKNSSPRDKSSRKSCSKSGIKEIRRVLLRGDGPDPWKRRRLADINRRKMFTEDTFNSIKIIVDPENNNSGESTQGPNKIIKVVVPPNGRPKTTQGPNQIVKVVVPKKGTNGKEIYLEQSEINKILNIVSDPKRSPGNSAMKTCISKKNAEQKVLKLFTQGSEQCKVLKPISPPRNIDPKKINLITLNSSNSKTLVQVMPPKITEKRLSPPKVNRKRNRLISPKLVPIETSNVPEIGTSNVPEVGTSDVPEVGTTNITEIGTTNVPEIETSIIEKRLSPPKLIRRRKGLIIPKLDPFENVREIEEHLSPPEKIRKRKGKLDPIETSNVPDFSFVNVDTMEEECSDFNDNASLDSNDSLLFVRKCGSPLRECSCDPLCLVDIRDLSDTEMESTEQQNEDDTIYNSDSNLEEIIDNDSTSTKIYNEFSIMENGVEISNENNVFLLIVD